MASTVPWSSRAELEVPERHCLTRFHPGTEGCRVLFIKLSVMG